jgi:hypothetical protein
MKALAMLDHVMLWVARGFSVLFLLFGLLVLCMELYLPPDYHKRNLLLGVILPATAILWLVSLWNRNLVTRLLLGITATACFVSTASTFADCLMNYLAFGPFSSDFASNLVVTFLALCGMASVMWISIRPAKNAHFGFQRSLIPNS